MTRLATWMLITAWCCVFSITDVFTFHEAGSFVLQGGSALLIHWLGNRR